MSRLLARLLALVCLIGVSPIARAAAVPSAITQRDVVAAEVQVVGDAVVRVVADASCAPLLRAPVVFTSRLFLAHRALLI